MNFLLLNIILFFLSLHPLHVSVTEIEHDAKAEALEVTMRIFIDDLELSIQNDLNKPHMDITAPGPDYSTDELVKSYLQEHFKISVNNKEIDYQYLGHEVELPVIYLYILSSGVKNVNEISVYNDMITETYDDQANLVHVTVHDHTKSMKLSKDRRKDSLDF